MSTSCIQRTSRAGRHGAIHDYIQLVFQEDRFNILNPPTLTKNGHAYRPGEPGFCDELVGLIESRPIAVECNDMEDLCITFASGTSLYVLTSDPLATGPEAWHFWRNGRLEFVAITR